MTELLLSGWHQAGLNERPVLVRGGIHSNV